MSSSLVPAAPGLDTSRREWMPVFALTFQVISATLVLVRVASRFTGQSTFGADDVFIVAALVTAIGITVLVLLSTYTAGFDRHIWEVPWTQWMRGALIARLVEVFFLVASCFNKVSVLLFYRRVVQGTCTKRYKIAVWAALTFVVVYTVVFEILLWVSCRPAEAIYQRYNPMYKKPYVCWSQKTETWTSQLAGALSVFSDFYAVLLPGFLIPRLHITRRQKIALYAVFGLGFSIVAAGIVRTIYLGQILDGKNSDLSWLGFNAFAASLAEIQLGIICACAPSLKSIFNQFFERTVSTVSRSLSSHGSSKPTVRMRRRSARKSVRKMESADSGTINLTADSRKTAETPRTAPRGVLKWPGKRPEIRETTNSFVKAHEASIVESEMDIVSPVPQAYEGMASPRVAPSIESFDTFRRWEEREGGSSERSRGSDWETIYIGKAV